MQPFFYYSFVFLVANLAQKHYSSEQIPLLFRYVLMNSSYLAYPFLILVGITAVMQMAYDIYFCVENMLVTYRELMYKSYTTRLDRLEKIRLFGKEAIQNIETGEVKAQFTLALEETTPQTKAILIALILLFNVLLAGFISDFWFFVVLMGSCSCPFVAYAAPAEIYATMIKKQTGKNAYGAIFFKYFALVMMIVYSALAMFAWHVRVFIRSPII